MVTEKEDMDLLVMVYGDRNRANQDGRDLHIEHIRYLRFSRDPDDTGADSKKNVVIVVYFLNSILMSSI